jgi:hypothetical protein
MHLHGAARFGVGRSRLTRFRSSTRVRIGASLNGHALRDRNHVLLLLWLEGRGFGPGGLRSFFRGPGVMGFVSF